jgi:hypothetical protein
MLCPGSYETSTENYTIHLSPYNKDIVFNYLYINGLRQNFGPHDESLQTDTVNNTYTIRTSKSTFLVGPPQNYPGEALISYTYKGKTDTLIIRNFVRPKTATR